MTREIVDRLLVRVGDACGEQTVRDRLGVHVGEAVRVQVVNERCLERLHELLQRAAFGLDGAGGLDAVADGARELCQTNRKLAGRGDDLTVAKREGGAPLLAPRNRITVILGPGEVLCQLYGNGVEVQRGVAVVPTEHLEGRQIVAVTGCREVGEADLSARHPRRSWRRRVGHPSPRRSAGRCWRRHVS